MGPVIAQIEDDAERDNEAPRRADEQGGVMGKFAEKVVHFQPLEMELAGDQRALI